MVSFWKFVFISLNYLTCWIYCRHPICSRKENNSHNHLLLRNKIIRREQLAISVPAHVPPPSDFNLKKQEEKRPYCPETRVLCPRYLFGKCLSYSHKKIVKDAKEKKKEIHVAISECCCVSCGSHFFFLLSFFWTIPTRNVKRKKISFYFILFFIRGNFIIRSLFERIPPPPYFVRVSLLFFLLLVFYFAYNSPPDISHSVQLMSMVV